MGSIEDALLLPMEEEQIELTEAGQNCLLSYQLLQEAARLLRSSKATVADRLALAQTIQTYLDEPSDPLFSNMTEEERQANEAGK